MQQVKMREKLNTASIAEGEAENLPWASPSHPLCDAATDPEPKGLLKHS